MNGPMFALSIVLMVMSVLALVFFIPMHVMDMDHGKISQIWKGCVSNDHFDLMMDAIFKDPNAYRDGYNMIGGGYKVWYCSGWGFLKINEVRGFSMRQKYNFFKHFKKFKQVRLAASKSAEELLTTPALRAQQDAIVEKQLLGD